jgi:hypothetical protein
MLPTAKVGLEQKIETRTTVERIAGTAWLDESKEWMAKGPTGTSVRTFTNLAMNS